MNKDLRKLTPKEFINKSRLKGLNDNDIFIEMSSKYGDQEIKKWLSKTPQPIIQKYFHPLFTILGILLIGWLISKVIVITTYPWSIQLFRYPFNIHFSIIAITIISTFGIIKNIRVFYIVLFVTMLFDCVFSFGELKNYFYLINQCLALATGICAIVINTEYYRGTYNISKIKDHKGQLAFPNNSDKEMSIKPIKILSIIITALFSVGTITVILMNLGFKEMSNSYGLIPLLIPISLAVIVTAWSFHMKPTSRIKLTLILGSTLFCYLGVVSSFYDMKSKLMLASIILNITPLMLFVNYSYSSRILYNKVVEQYSKLSTEQE